MAGVGEFGAEGGFAQGQSDGGALLDHGDAAATGTVQGGGEALGHGRVLGTQTHRQGLRPGRGRPQGGGQQHADRAP